MEIDGIVTLHLYTLLLCHVVSCGFHYYYQMLNEREQKIVHGYTTMRSSIESFLS